MAANSAYYSYNGEFINLDNVILAKPIDDTKVKLFITGSAGAGNSHKYDIQHREHVMIWPKPVWDKIMEESSHSVTFNEETGKVKIS